MVATWDERLRSLEVSFGYYLRDLGHIPIEGLAPDPAARAGLVALRYSHQGGEAEKMRVPPQVLAALPKRSDFEKQVLSYVMGVSEVQLPEFHVAAEQAKLGRGEAVVGQVVQELIEEGKAQGLAQALAGTLSELLEHHFGRLPRPVRSRIAVAAQPELNAWFTTALGARSLAEVFPDLDLE